MAVIGTVRNHLVHWGAGAASDGTFTVSNAGRSPLKPMDYSVTIEDLKNMYNDLTNIIILLVLERNDSPNPLCGTDSCKLHGNLNGLGHPLLDPAAAGPELERQQVMLILEPRRGRGGDATPHLVLPDALPR
jgi:hypothetical protein